MSLHVLGFKFKRVLNIIGIVPLMAALKPSMNRTPLIVGQNQLSKPQVDQIEFHWGQMALLEKKNVKDAKAETQSTQSNAFQHSLGPESTIVEGVTNSNYLPAGHPSANRTAGSEKGVTAAKPETESINFVRLA